MGRCCYILLRRRHDVPIKRRGDVPLRRLGNVPSRRRWVIHLRLTCNVAGTYRETSLRLCHDVLLPVGLKCRKNTESKNPKVARTKNGRIMLLPKCPVCDSQKSKFLKQQEASGLLSSLGTKTSLSKIPLVGPVLF